MERRLRFAVVLVAALCLVPFLPMYLERTMVRSWQVNHVGDAIEWGWKLRTLGSYWSNYSYLRPEQHPTFWLGVNLALCFTYAMVIALGVDRLFARRKTAESFTNGVG